MVVDAGRFSVSRGLRGGRFLHLALHNGVIGKGRVSFIDKVK